MRELLLDFFELKYNLYIYNIKASRVVKWFFFLNYKLVQIISDLVAFVNSHEIWNCLKKFVIWKEKSFQSIIA